MALFFDQKWFNEKLAAAGVSSAQLAQALGLSEEELAEMWKDQREITDGQIGTMALLLGVPEAEVKKRGGLQGTPEAKARLENKRGEGAKATTPPAPTELEQRVARLELEVEDLKRRLNEKS